jgi:hypothetical protein
MPVCSKQTCLLQVRNQFKFYKRCTTQSQPLDYPWTTQNKYWALPSTRAQDEGLRANPALR